MSSYNAARENSRAFVAATDGMKALGQTLGEVGGLVGTVADGSERMLAAISPLASWLSNFLKQDRRGAIAIRSRQFQSSLSLMGTAFNGEEAGPKTLGDYQAETDADEAAKMDKLLKEQQWVNFKRRQAAGFSEEDCAGWRNRNEVGQDWRRGWRRWSRTR